MFWNNKPPPMPEDVRLRNLLGRFRAMSAARKMLESGTTADRIMMSVNLNSDERITAHRASLPFSFTTDPASGSLKIPADRYLAMRAVTLTDPGSRFRIHLVLPEPKDAEEPYDRIVADDPGRLAEAPPFDLRLIPEPEGAPIPKLRGEIARIFNSFESGIDLATKGECILKAAVLGSNLVRPESTIAFVQPDQGEWQLFRINEPVDFLLALNFAKGWGEVFSKGANLGDRNPGRHLANALA